MASLGHSRATSIANPGYPVAGAFRSPGRPGADSGPGNSPIPHIDDILAVPSDIDTNASIRKLLDMAEASLRQAEMSRDFNRPALALKDYIRASVIAIQVVRNHRDYSFLKQDREDLAKAHALLLKKISQQDAAFAQIKQEIIADNRITGVRPTVDRSGPRQGNENSSASPSPLNSSSGRGTAASIDNSLYGSPEHFTNGSASRPKPKPTVQPKPQSLAGNAIKPSFGVAASAAQDLAARFANLRGPQSSPGQDPRIKTHAIVPPQQVASRMSSPPEKPQVSLNSSIPPLPKMPDAIYSPARGSVSGESTRQPPGAPRGLYRSGTGSSVASIPSTPTPSSHQQSDYFPAAQSYSMAPIPPVPPGNALKVPSGGSVTPEELYQAMKAKGSILIIDVRPREDFNEGHIMSSSTICIEPSILLRENVSADQIAESMVISPNQEQPLFEQRDKYDLVVFYDQDSESMPKMAHSSRATAVTSLHRALVEFNYMHDLKNPPKLLKGGLDAWVDLLGPGALQTSAATASRPLPRQRDGAGVRNLAVGRKGSKYVVKPLKPDEVKVWQETLKNDDDIQTASSPSFLRTTEDFLRRFPPVATEQESMTSSGQEHRPAYGLSHKVDLYTDLPSPPTRPAPALPRPSYSSLPEGVVEGEGFGSLNGSAVGRAPTRAPAKVEQHSTGGDKKKAFTGLNNPQNWCYANSTLQCLLGSPEFGKQLSDSLWMKKYHAPRKEDEKMDHPQLMTRIISNLFHWMSSGKFQVMKAQILMDYSRDVCLKSRTVEEFGGQAQQDAQEFMSFLLEHLHDETNTRRDRRGQVEQPDTKSQSLAQAAKQYWSQYQELNQSIVDRYWRGLELGTVECLECHTRTYQFSPFGFLPITVNMTRDMTLEQALMHHTAGNTLDDFECAHCQRHTKALQAMSFARMPELLCFAFRRFQYQQPTQDLAKSTATITWDFNDCDLSRYFIKTDPRDNADGDGDGDAHADADPAFSGPFRYEAYAVVIHGGKRVDSGHYWAYVRDSTSHDPYAWVKVNDTQVTRVRIGSNDPKDIMRTVFKDGYDRVPYLVFFRRKGMR